MKNPKLNSNIEVHLFLYDFYAQNIIFKPIIKLIKIVLYLHNRKRF